MSAGNGNDVARARAKLVAHCSIVLDFGKAFLLSIASVVCKNHIVRMQRALLSCEGAERIYPYSDPTRTQQLSPLLAEAAALRASRRRFRAILGSRFATTASSSIKDMSRVASTQMFVTTGRPGFYYNVCQSRIVDHHKIQICVMQDNGLAA